MADLQPGVIYRTDPLTADDYTKVIEEMEAAKLDVDDESIHCAVCWGDDHAAKDCMHNALVMARRGVAAIEREFWRCFHCGEVFRLDQETEAREHFGKDEDEPAACQQGEDA